MPIFKNSHFKLPVFSWSRDYVNVAALCPNTRVLGPGIRFVIWVQGCCFDCPGCISSKWRDWQPARLFTVEELTQAIIQTPNIEGITLSGGEPMMQAARLYDLITAATAQKTLTVICYTGFSRDALHQMNNPAVIQLLSALDVLIDGPYMDHLNNDLGLRGSTNQQVHFLTDAYRHQADMFLDGPRHLEVHLFQKRYLTVGIHRRKDATDNIDNAGGN